MTTESMKPYPAYKDSGIEWVGEIPEGWDMRKVSRSFALIGSGTTPKSNDNQYYQNGDISWIITGDLNNGLLNSSSKTITSKALGDYSTLKMYPKNTLIVAMYGATIGKICLTNFEACTNQACCALSKSPYLLNRFTFYWFIANKHNIINMSYGGGQPNISQDIIRSLKITTPSLAEQNIIITFLDNQTAEIDTLIENKQKQIELLKEERTAIINQAVTKGLNPDAPMRDSGIEWLGEIPEHWDVKPLFTVAHEQKTKNKSGFEKNVLSLSYGNIVRRDVESNFGLLPESFNTYQIVDSGNIILRLTDLQNDKRSLRVGLVKETGIITSAYVCLKVNDDYDPKYVYDLLHSYDLRKVFYTMGGGLRQTLRFEELKRLPMLCSPLQEQNEITTFLTRHANKIDTVVKNNKNQITLLKEYRTALISEAVTGKIDLRNQHEIPTPQ